MTPLPGHQIVHSRQPNALPRTRGWQILLLAGVYLLLAQLSLWLARPPSLAAPFWPAAGVAVAAIMFWGRGCWPGIWLGAFLSSMLSRGSPELGDPSTSVLLSATFAVGASSQALVGSQLLRPAGQVLTTTAGKTPLVTLLTIGGPVVCILSATVGTAGLYWIQGLPAEALLAIWITWWAGDSLGVLLVVPVLASWRLLRLRESRKMLQFMLLPVLTAALVMTGYYWLARAEQIGYQQEIAAGSEYLRDQINSRVRQQNQAVEAIADLFATDTVVTAEAFRRFTHRALNQDSIAWLAWAALEAPGTGLNSEPTVSAASGQLPAVSLRLLAKKPDRQVTPGLDIAADPVYHDAVRRALVTGGPVQSLVRQSTTGALERLLLVPLFRAEFDPSQANMTARQAALRGFAVGSLSIDGLTSSIPGHLRQHQLAARLIQQATSGRAPVSLFQQAVPVREPDWVGQLDDPLGPVMQLQTWSLMPWEPGQSVPMRVYLVAAVLVLLFATLLVLIAASQHVRVRRDVERRTAELTAAQTRLRSILDNMAVMVAELSPAGNIVEINRTALNAIGLPRDAVIGQPFDQLDGFACTPDVQARIREDLCRAGNGENIRHDLDFRLADGTSITLDFRLVPVTDEQGEVVKLIPSAADIRERQRSERALAESRAQLQRVIEGSRLGFWDWDLVRNVVTFSGTWATMLGYHPDELSPAYETWRELIHPDDKSRTLRAFDDMLYGRSDHYEAEHRLRTKSGDWRWVLSRGNIISRDRDGSPLFVSGIHTDIHGKKELELALKDRETQLQDINANLEQLVAERTAQLYESDRFMRALLDALSAHIAVLDEWGVIVATNESWRKFAAANAESPERVSEGINYLEVCDRSGCEGAEVADLVRQVIHGECSEGSFEYPCHAPDEPRWFMCRVTRFQGDGPVRVVLAHQNITKRKLAEQTTRQLADELQATLQAVPDLLFDLDEQGRYHQVWSSDDSLLATQKPTLLGRQVNDVLPPEAAQTVMQAIQAAIETGHAQGHQIRLDLPQGPCWFELSAAAKRSQTEGPKRVMMLSRDITSRRQAEDSLRQLNDELEQRVQSRTEQLRQAQTEAEQANQAKSAFLATMSHEIRTPLNGVIGMVDVLEQTNLERHQLDMVELIRVSALSLLDIIDDILDLSKIEAGSLEMERAPFPVAAVVEKTCAMLDTLAAKKGVELTLFTDPNLPDEVLGDELRVRQILLNLTSNAIKFSSERDPGRVSVRAQAIADNAIRVKVAFQVADNGIGMDTETRSGLFTAFRQADASTTRRFGGSGLGLAITHHLVTMMDGEIQVESESGEGSVFTVTLPFDLASEADENASSPSLVGGLECLVVGSDSSMADDLIVYLTYAGASATRIADIQTALDSLGESVASRPPVLVIDAEGPSARILARLHQLSGADEVHCVVIERGQRRRPRLNDSSWIMVDGNVLTRQTLLSAVSLASGRLPIEQQWQQPGHLRVKVRPPTREEALQQGRLLLVAEDNEANQKVLAHQLALLGYAADIAENGHRALALWRNGDYALLLTDLHMPEMDGYQLSTAIRSEERNDDHKPIIALTANALKGEAKRCFDVGMDDYLTKPARLEELHSVLERWMPGGAPEPIDTSMERDRALSSSLHAAVDTSVLEGLVGDDPEVVHEFLQEFYRYGIKAAYELNRAFESGQVQEVGALAHKLKSSAHSIGALRLAECCDELEKIANAKGTTRLVELMDRFNTEMADVKAFLERR
ncbi:PAS domain S-box protein [Marinobacterium sp. D7]|uniref:PAS domain S-box protein n=1 Tax=Marinobacterium ramblicola TaxID=2849041 RepID=UPI001C2D2F8B|nr:PAS domain S-box protein [Marinobacterium ramblicola]MBV1787958.1 PAS domain S-box protein [Marinobacterium ramblicola]